MILNSLLVKTFSKAIKTNGVIGSRYLEISLCATKIAAARKVSTKKAIGYNFCFIKNTPPKKPNIKIYTISSSQISPTQN